MSWKAHMSGPADAHAAYVRKCYARQEVGAA